MNILRLPAKMESLETFRSFVTGKIEETALQSIIHQVELVLEEVLVNIISYAYADDGFIEVECDAGKPDAFCIIVRDWGVAFNPLDRGEPDLSRDISDRQIGGLGIHLVRQMASKLKYERKDGTNILMVVFEKDRIGRKN